MQGEGASAPSLVVGSRRYRCVAVPEHNLLPSQKNDVFEAIREVDLHPGDFEWGETLTRAAQIWASEDYLVPLLTHRRSDYYFVFDWTQEGEHEAYYVPGQQSYAERFRTVA